jgi:hypothetical protein
MNEVQETVDTNEVVPTKKVKIKNSTPNIGKFYRSRQRIIVPHDRTYDAGRNKAKLQRKEAKKSKPALAIHDQAAIQTNITNNDDENKKL